ncbi:MFS transporter [Pseudomonas cavernae]|uniref:MFS transporter n=1 Tax=Pseudomonas cavernae TaxID=2320867 RepID=A0A385Z0M3_9PSED|nr:MFS transporter [Pseudomonas cavernae]AYC31438.1 MFS transporter [Pseudomonas cavernae]
MNRSQWRRRLALEWWLQLALTLAPWLLLKLWVEAEGPSRLAMPLFIAGLLAMFLSLPLFRAYKHALIATQQAFDSSGEDAAWRQLGQRRRRALLGAGLPAWIAALGLFAGLEGVPQLLLLCSSLVLLVLYRIPRQLR